MNIYKYRNEQGKIIPIKLKEEEDGTYSLDLALFKERQPEDEVIYFYVGNQGDTIKLLCKSNGDGTYSIYTRN